MTDTTARDAGEELDWWAVMFPTDGGVYVVNTPTGDYDLCYQTVHQDGTRYHEAHVQAATEAEAIATARVVLTEHYGAGFTGAHDAAPPAEALVERVALAIGRRDECEFDDDGNPTNCPSDESLIFEWSDHARDAIAAVRAHDATPPAPEGTIHIGSAEIRPFKDPIRAHDAAPTAEDAVERVADIFRGAKAGRYASHQDAARAALAVMPAPGATLEGLLREAWDQPLSIFIVNHDEHGIRGGYWAGLTIYDDNQSEHGENNTTGQGAGPTVDAAIRDAIRVALEAAEGKGDV